MKIHTIFGNIATAALGAILFGTDMAAARDQSGAQDFEVLTRGPVHEAFAGTVSYNPDPGIIVAAQVPDPIEELPPEQRLEGDNVAWIPGYWAWDEEQNDFLWISGIWRNLPPGRQWVPGYWSEVNGGYQWTSGYWEDAATTEVSYLPEPPRSLEVGPNIAAPSNDQSWIPGSWIWNDSRYAWRAGYWSPVRENWIWVPGHYRWTHRGYIYVDGYWDYAVPRRGVLFAPVHFGRNVYSRPGFLYSPATVISLLVFSNHLFLKPNYCHYYFGDYYAPRYRDRGYYASHSYHSSRRGCDPIYSHYRWENRGNRNWDKQRREYFEYRRDHENSRPPHTFKALAKLSEKQRGSGSNYAVAEPLSRYVNTRGDGRQRFQSVAKKDRQQLVIQTQDVRKYAQQRKQLETRAETTAAAGSTERVKARRSKVGRSPVVAKIDERSDKSIAPPKRLEKRVSEQSRASTKTAKPKPIVRPGRERPTIPDAKKGRDLQPDKKSRGEPKPQSIKPPEPSTKHGNVRRPIEIPDRKMTHGKKSQGVPPPGIRKPEPSPKAVPRPSRKTTPDVKRQVDASPTRKAVPEPRKAEPIRSKKVQKTSSRQVQPPQSAPQPSRKASPVPPQRSQPKHAPQRSKSRSIPESDTSTLDYSRHGKSKRKR